ncbi:helix-turn-helix transcriptional regulator [Flammeovirgaceae bacterium SG7u.111]|nr:helix-turn-helix transcriptional regulator [Flammeovirgaceae bacterium SG7u.132]WPO37135.1 helix-turn-helix transcriptional regulator [Flammeovirgaceae bacterium SG7u.111]
MKQFQLGEFEEIVLLTVGILHGNAYGVTIKDEIEQRLDRQVSVGALQTTLRRLEKKGYLTSSHGDSSEARGGRPKLFFTMTAYGKQAIDYTRQTRNKLWDSLPPFILNLG